MRSYLRRLLEALECLVSSIEALRDMYATAHDFKLQSGNVEARVEELERMRVLHEASMEGELMLAKAEYRKADNAAARAKTTLAQAGQLDEGDGESVEEFEERLREWNDSRNGARGEDGQLHQVPALVAEAQTARETLKEIRRSRR